MTSLFFTYIGHHYGVACIFCPISVCPLLEFFTFLLGSALFPIPGHFELTCCLVFYELTCLFLFSIVYFNCFGSLFHPHFLSLICICTSPFPLSIKTLALLPFFLCFRCLHGLLEFGSCRASSHHGETPPQAFILSSGGGLSL